MRIFLLIRYEWQKNYLKGVVMMVILLFSLLDIVYIGYRYTCDSNFSYSPGWRKAYWELYDRFSGTITSEKLDKLEALYLPLAQKVADRTFNTAINPDSLTGINDFGDYLLLGNYYVAEMEMFCKYSQKAEEVARIARENVSLYNALGDSYQARKNVKIYHLFHGRSISDFAYLEPCQRITDYVFSNWMVLLVCLFAASGSFTQEKEAQMDRLLKTTPGGYGATACAKIVAALVFVLAVTLWFSAVDYTGFALVYGSMDGEGLPVYALPDFAYSPLSCPIWQYFLLLAVGKVIGNMIFTLLCCLLSSICSNALIPFLAGGSLSVALCLMADVNRNLYHTVCKMFNPGVWLYGKALYGQAEYINVCGEPVALPIAAFFWAVFIGTVLVCGICKGYKSGKIA